MTAGAAVQRQDGDARDRLHAVSDVRTVIGQVAETVFRGEDGAYVYALGDEGVQDVGLGVAHQPRLIRENSYPLAFQQGHIHIELLVSQNYALFFGSRAGDGYEAADEEDGGQHPAMNSCH